MSTKSSFREALEQRGEAKEKSREQSGFPVRLMLELDDIKQPVSVTRLLTKRGMTLRKAHETVSRLADRRAVAVELYADNVGKLTSELSALGVKAYPIELPEIDLRRIRDRLGLSQAEFALRFCLELDTVQNWEQGRYRPDLAAQVLLGLIEANPEFVDSVLTKRSHREPQ